MKKRVLLLCALIAPLTWGVAAPAKQKVNNDANKPLKIVFENDVHGSVDRYEYIAGFRDALVEAGYPVLTVSAGDFLQGSAYAAMSKGQFCVDMMNTVGYDIVTVGNHDFDYGLPYLQSMRDSLKQTALICSNVLDAEGNACFPAYTITNVGGYKVAFIGVVTTATEQLEAYSVFDKQGNRQISFSKENLVETVQKAVDKVRLGKPDWVILLAHMGIDPLGEHLASWELLEQLEGVDLLIDGHSHSVINAEVQGKDPEKRVAVAQTGSGLAYVGCVTLMRGVAPRVQLYSSQNLAQSAKVHEAYLNVVALTQPLLGRVVGYTPVELTTLANGERAVRKQETNIGDLVADAYRDQMHTDIGWVNGGGVRTNIMTGDITYGNILSVSPFNNFMCAAEISGQQLLDALEEAYNECPDELGAFAQISGVRCVVDTTIHNKLEWSAFNELTVVGDRRVSNVEVLKDGEWKSLDVNATYTIGSTDYVVYEGESRGLKAARILNDKMMTDTECLQNYIINTLEGTIPNTYAKTQGRIRFAK